MLLLKECAKCKNKLPFLEFNKELRSKYKLQRWFKPCQRVWRKHNVERLMETNRKCRLKNPEKYKLAARRNNLRAYGMTLEDYNNLLELQQKACAICRITVSGGKHNVFHVDHDHKTGMVRGLLCHHCNKGIGQLKDSVVVLEQAIVYLKNSCTHFSKSGGK